VARFHHSFALTPVPRSWFDRAVATAFDVVTEHLGGAHLPLVDGSPLAPGAHYENDTTVITLDAWSRHGESAGRVTTTDDGATTTCHVRLHSAAAPRALQFEGGVSAGSRMTTGTGGFTVDFERWWTGRGTAVLGRFDHRVARGMFEAGRAAGDRWQVEVVVTVRGRGLFRPLVAPALAIARRRLRRAFVRELDRFAAQWDEAVPTYVAMPPDELRALVDGELTGAGH
jgi:hypothetical protein